jgi:hypothetical protein
MKVLVAGWFSFEGMGATAGDLLSRDLVCLWLGEGGIPFDVAVAPPFVGGSCLSSVDPTSYTHVVFVCGPFGNGPPVTDFLERFGGCRLFGINLSMLQDLEEWDPFELLVERDSNRTSRPDLTFLADRSTVPVVGTVLVHPQSEYGRRALHERANAAIDRLLANRSVSRVSIDTRLDINVGGLRTPAEVESLLARMDVIVTTRLHGLVLGIRNALPVLAIDPIAGGAKIFRQAKTIEWPAVFKADEIVDWTLNEAFEYCLTQEAREQAVRSRVLAAEKLSSVRDSFTRALEATRTVSMEYSTKAKRWPE